MFDTQISKDGNVISGPLRAPAQMLEDQSYDGHSSIHEDGTAEKLGFQAGPIEGPTHFSQFDPLMVEIWGKEWFEKGCISSHFKNMVVEGEEVRAFVELPENDAQTRLRAWAEKADGTPVLEASVSLGAGPTLLDERRALLREPGKLVILENMSVGMTGAKDEIVTMKPDQHMGDLYPFTLNQKLSKITESTPWFKDDSASPWGRAIIPTEMISVLVEYTAREAKFPVKHPAIGLFADLEIRYVDGPLFVGETYLIRREIVAISDSRRTESYWTKSQVFDATGKTLKAEMVLNHAVLKASYPNYEAELNA
ncbi:hypothetical protein [Ponticaulis profundi]|uniref:MaoC-like domain-containing protein n=1 Tax=Ponticaulis profundi TaxID=2665222 RepID=A0ABW1SB35_9PROT